MIHKKIDFNQIFVNIKLVNIHKLKIKFSRYKNNTKFINLLKIAKMIHKKIDFNQIFVNIKLVNIHKLKIKFSRYKNNTKFINYLE